MCLMWTLKVVEDRYGQHEDLQFAFRIFEVGFFMAHWFRPPAAVAAYGVSELTGALRSAYNGCQVGGWGGFGFW